MLLKLQLEYVYVIKFSFGLNYCLNFITGIIFSWPNVATKNGWKLTLFSDWLRLGRLSHTRKNIEDKSILKLTAKNSLR